MSAAKQIVEIVREHAAELARYRVRVADLAALFGVSGAYLSRVLVAAGVEVGRSPLPINWQLSNTLIDRIWGMQYNWAANERCRAGHGTQAWDARREEPPQAMRTAIEFERLAASAWVRDRARLIGAIKAQVQESTSWR